MVVVVVEKRTFPVARRGPMLLPALWARSQCGSTDCPQFGGNGRKMGPGWRLGSPLSPGRK